VKGLPEELQSLDLEAIGSVVSFMAPNKSKQWCICYQLSLTSKVVCQVTDEDIMKEAKPSFYRKNILPILIKNRVVHFLGFGHRLAFDPIPFQLQVQSPQSMTHHIICGYWVIILVFLCTFGS